MDPTPRDQMKPWPAHTFALVSGRLGDPFVSPIVGSHKKQCYCCEHEIWVEPKAIADYEQGGYQFLCIQCAYTLTRGWKDTVLIRRT